MANWIYNLLHGKLPGKGFLGRSSTDSGPGELLDPAAARTLLDLHEDGEPLFARLTVGPSFKNPDIGFNADLPSLTGSGLSIVLDAGGSNTLEGGDIDISAGAGQTDGGNITITPGGAATGSPGEVTISGPVNIDGAISIVDGSEGLGKFLNSDANGLASWNTFDSSIVQVTQQQVDNLNLPSVAQAGLTSFNDEDSHVTVRDVYDVDNDLYHTLSYYYDSTSTATVDDLEVLAVGNATGRLLLKDTCACNVFTRNNADFFDSHHVEGQLQEIGEDFFKLADDVAIRPFVVTQDVTDSVWTVTITQPEELNLLFNIDTQRIEHTSDVMTVDATAFVGTDSNPNTVYVYVARSGAIPILVASNTNPESSSIHHVDVGIFKKGSVSTTSVESYAGIIEPVETYEFLSATWHLFQEQGIKYRAGLAVTATQTDLAVGAGQIRTVLRKKTTEARSVGVDGFYFVDSSGNYARKSDFSFGFYGDGGPIGVGKYYSVTFAIVVGEFTQLLAMVQNEPSTEYNSAQAALSDIEDKKVISPSDTTLQRASLPVCRVIIQNDTNDYLQSISGSYWFPVAGTAGGAASVPGTTVNPGNVQDDMISWNAGTGEYDPKTPVEIKAILGLGATDNVLFGSLSLSSYLKLPGSSVEIDGLESAALVGSGTALVAASLVKVISDALSSLTGNVLQLDNTTPFTPDADYEPATKKYVDDSPPGGTASGDLSGTYPSPTVAKIQGVAISAAAPSDGQILTYDTTNGWQPEDAPAGGSGYWSQVTGYLSPSTVGDALRVGDNGYSFASDTDTMLRRSGANEMELVAGTQVKVTVATTGVTIPTLAVTSLDIAKILPTGGTTAAPEFSKAADSNTGVHLAGGDVLELVAGSIARATVTNTGVTIPTLSVTTLNINTFRALTNGTASSTSHGWVGDVDNGMYRIGTNEFGFSAASLNRMTISSAGVTIPTLAVTSLDIAKILPTGGTTAAPEFSKAADPNTGVHLVGGDVLELVTAAQSRITISDNDISIGMDTADYVGFFGGTPVVRQPELTDELTDNITAITHTDPVTPDYAIQDLTDTGGFGFATKDEGNTVLAQIRELQLQVKNLRTRNIQLENTLAAYNLIVDAD